ncbi:hypothetical protein Poly30_34700 [Planctomycetes bacterium Poly30]|uniref:Right handed beta helix domain-containing protein n=1 Tax=Saltatorellus ferox TaxID=2528018 RepID=A0A518EV41_9BACT|nr:hypothetical protein Poly30_34700 [Planctomycetes bacterium Poly30]
MLALTLALLAAPQTTWYVDSAAPGPGTGTLTDPYSRVDHAVAQPATVDGDTLVLASGSYPAERVLLGSKELTLEAAPGAMPVLQSDGYESLITAGPSSQLTVRGLRFEGPASQGGFPPPRGGAIQASGDGLVVEDCSFAQLRAWEGGAIYSTDTSVTLRRVSVEVTCSADNYGGALWLDAGSVLIEDCDLRGFALYGAGGVVFLEGGTVSIVGSSLSGSAYEHGGTIYTRATSLTLRECDVTGLSREDYFGGGLYQQSGTVTVDTCSFHDCTAIRGGAIWAQGGSLALVDSSFLDNQTRSIVTMGIGGAGAVGCGAALIERCVFARNRATHDPLTEAGAIAGRPTLLHCTFIDNAASAGASDVVFGSLPSTPPALVRGCLFLTSAANQLPLVTGSADLQYNLANRPLPSSTSVLATAQLWADDSFYYLPGSPGIDLLPLSFGTDPDGTPLDAGAYPFDPSYCGPGCDGPLGTVACTALPNTTGVPSSISGLGSTVVAANRVVLNVEDLPSGSFGYFIASQTPAYVPGAGGSSGAICVGGQVLRFNRDVLQPTPNFRNVSFRPLLDDLPGPNVVQPGEQWYFQFWHRDGGPVAPTSNFSPSLSVQF